MNFMMNVGVYFIFCLLGYLFFKFLSYFFIGDSDSKSKLGFLVYVPVLAMLYFLYQRIGFWNSFLLVSLMALVATIMKEMDDLLDGITGSYLDRVEPGWRSGCGLGAENPQSYPYFRKWGFFGTILAGAAAVILFFFLPAKPPLWHVLVAIASTFVFLILTSSDFREGRKWKKQRNRLRGQFGEPYCSKKCRDKGMSIIRAMGNKEFKFKCAICNETVTREVGESIYATMVVPYKKQILSVCSNCKLKAEKLLEKEESCGICGSESLSD